MTSCSSEDDLTDNNNQQPASQSKLVTLTTTVGRDGTRALAGDGTKTFAVGETMAIVYVNNSGNTVKAESAPLAEGDILDGNQSATFTFTLDDPNKDATVSYYYPAAMVKDNGDINYEALYSNQDGTLTTLGGSFDYCKQTGLSWNDGNLPPATLSNELSILAINLKDDATGDPITSSITGMTIDVNDVHYTVISEAADGPIYVAIKPASGTNVYITATDGSKNYTKTLTGKTYEANNGYNVSWRMTEVVPSKVVDLSTLTGDYVAKNGDVLTGSTNGTYYKISIADRATVMLDNVNINPDRVQTYGPHAGLTCLGDATIILKEGTTNKVREYDDYFPGIQGAQGKTLTIMGTGSLYVASSNWAPGIGSGLDPERPCGNIVIAGGTITSEALGGGPGIGTATRGICGNITIYGGTVTAIGRSGGAGIGTTSDGTCGNITITSGVTKVTSIKGEYATNNIGVGYRGTRCGTVTIGGVVYAGGITTSPYTYQP